MEIQGKVYAISEEQQISEKFKKREFVIKTDHEYRPFVKMELQNKYCDAFEKYGIDIGDNVEVSFNLEGREHINKSDGEVRYYTNIIAWKIMTDG